MVRLDILIHSMTVYFYVHIRYHPNIELADKIDVYFPDGTWCATVNGVNHFCL